CQQHEDSPRTF
nr:immunoglobulin light chain junction region [Macaca mulatta]MOV93489.1 immunoglobulin light chain junction region [Macaca mulatta]MOV94054.1 immunoglobulin light chain junction region [Macaca mulatta]